MAWKDSYQKVTISGFYFFEFCFKFHCLLHHHTQLKTKQKRNKLGKQREAFWYFVSTFVCLIYLNNFYFQHFTSKIGENKAGVSHGNASYVCWRKFTCINNPGVKALTVLQWRALSSGFSLQISQWNPQQRCSVHLTCFYHSFVAILSRQQYLNPLAFSDPDFKTKCFHMSILASIPNHSRIP